MGHREEDHTEQKASTGCPMLVLTHVIAFAVGALASACAWWF